MDPHSYRGIALKADTVWISVEFEGFSNYLYWINIIWIKRKLKYKFYICTICIYFLSAYLQIHFLLMFFAVNFVFLYGFQRDILTDGYNFYSKSMLAVFNITKIKELPAVGTEKLFTQQKIVIKHISTKLNRTDFLWYPTLATHEFYTLNSVTPTPGL